MLSQSSMIEARSFPPISDPSARTLVLGSMPGKRSLEQEEYYAHPQNLFWPFVDAILGIPREVPYDERCEALKSRGIALWDTLKSCTRPGSLDSDIVRSSMVPNDFAAFLDVHPAIELIVFNGGTAERVFMKLAAPGLQGRLGAIRLLRLPSTSPANASIPVDTKLSAWRVISSGSGSSFRDHEVK